MAASTAIDSALVARFKEALDRLNPEGGKIVLAVSGGPDSMAMLLLAHAAIPGGYDVVTVDHGLRPEAKDECALVVAACEERGVKCTVLTVEVGEGNLQAKAREARYQAISDWIGTGTIATAHHADDQAETLLMRLNRGSGLAGLSGVRESYWTKDYIMRVIRPLLGFRRSELRSIVDASQVAFADDPSNYDDRFDRVRIRKHLAESDWLDPEAIAKSALYLAEANEFVDRHVDWQIEQHGSEENGSFAVRNSAGALVRARIIKRGIERFGGSVDVGRCLQLAQSVCAGEQANLGGVLVRFEERSDGPFLVFCPEPPRRTG